MFPSFFILFFGNASWFFLLFSISLGIFVIFALIECISWLLCAFSSAGPHFDFFHCFWFPNASAFAFWASFLVRFFFISCIFIYIYSLFPFLCRCFSAHTLVSLSARSLCSWSFVFLLVLSCSQSRCSFLEFYLLLQAFFFLCKFCSFFPVVVPFCLIVCIPTNQIQ